MIRPPVLQRGDTIGIVAPASYVTEAELQPAVKIITSWGLNLIFGNHVFKRRNSFAGTDAQRADDFQLMLNNPGIKAILCARGGYGSIRIINKLRFDNFVSHPKWIAGCSDITVFHAFLQQSLGAESLHSAMPRSISHEKPDIASLDSLRSVLFGELKEYTIRPHSANRPGEASGILIGGNLSVLYSMAGTPFDPDTRGRILFIEDLKEYLYHIDRMIMNFKTRGKLEGLSGLIIGAMNGMKVSQSGYHKPAYEIIREAASGYGYPVMFGFPSGHVHPNMSLIFGRKVIMRVNPGNCTLTF
jgi:muramoyltetrapeptide carboxypeptidase